MKVLGIEPCSIGRLESDDSAVLFFTMSLAIVAGGAELGKILEEADV